MIDAVAQPDYTPWLTALVVLAAINVVLLGIIAGMLGEAISLYRARRRKHSHRGDNTDRADWWRDN